MSKTSNTSNTSCAYPARCVCLSPPGRFEAPSRLARAALPPVTSIDCEQNAQKHGKCGLLAQLAQVLPTAFPSFTLAAPSRFYVMEIYPAKEMMTVASAFARRSRAARGARTPHGTAPAAPIG